MLISNVQDQKISKCSGGKKCLSSQEPPYSNKFFFYLRVLGLFILSSLNILLLLLNQSFCEICGCYHSCCLLNIILFHFQTSITVGLKAGIKDRVINFHSEIYENSVLEKLEKNGGKKGL